VTCALGPNIGMTDAGTVLDLNAMCMDLGLDPVSLGFTLSFAMECAEEGLATFRTAEGSLTFGAVGPVRAAIAAIARREGDGALLAEGSARAAARLSGGAGRLALHVKGLEMVPFEPRTQTNLALGFATAPIGPRYDICEHDWDFDPSVGWSHTLERTRTLGIHHRVPMQALSPDKVRNYKALNTLWSAADALGLCIFAIAPTRILTLDEMARMISDITGFDLSTYELMRIGERRNAVMRLYNRREGIGPEQDRLPDRFFDEPIRQGRWAGQRIDRAAFARSVASYYRMAGYDSRGLPTPDLLFDLNLGELAPLAESLARG
jgi:aldehyde:ferredoxin oxidoreductase